MARSLWFVAGAGAGVYAMSRARRVAEALTSDGLRDRLGGLGVGVRLFRDEVATGQAEKETELRERMGLTPHGVPELTTRPTAPTDRPADRPTDRGPDGHQ
jgi:hypothetical protein